MQLIVDGLHVTGSDTGQGPVVLLLHGWGSDHQTFALILKTFAGSRVIAPDLPGFGGSQVPPEAWSVGDYGEFVQHLLAKLKVDRVDMLVGHSFGGRIALDLLGRHLISAERAVLLASHGLPEPASLKRSVVRMTAKTGKVLTLGLPESARNAMRRRLYRLAGSQDYLDSGIMKDTFLRVIKQDVTAIAGDIKTPVCLIYGRQDKTTPLSLGQRLASLIPEAKLVTIADASHYVHIDQPAAVSEQIKQWVKV